MEHFIETVKKYPCLWNSTAIEYRDQELKDAAWAEVMRETNLASVKEVKLKWKKLRDSYRDALKRQSEGQAREPGAAPHAKKPYPWKYMGLMHFLQPHMSNRRKLQDSPAPAHALPEPAPAPVPAHNGLAAHSSSDSSSEEEGSSSAKRRAPPDDHLGGIDRKLEYLCAAAGAVGRRRRTRAPEPPDPLDIFFNGMCQATKRLPYAAQIAVKKTLFGAVVAAEEALLAEHQNYASLWASAGAGGAQRASRSPSSSEPQP